MRRTRCRVLLTLLVALSSNALAVTTWYVNGVSGSDGNNCMAPTSPCKTVGHAISLASAGDSVMVAAATYRENLTVGMSLKIVGASASTTILDGGGSNTVINVSSSTATVTFANLTIQHGSHFDGGGIYNNGALTISHSVVRENTAIGSGGGIYNNGTLRLNVSTVTGNKVSHISCGFCGSSGGGIANNGTLTINNSMITGNTAAIACGRICGAGGGGITNTSSGKMSINQSTVSGNTATATAQLYGRTDTGGGGIDSYGPLTITNSTIVNNTAKGGNSSNRGGGLESDGTTIISSSTIASNNSATGGGIMGSASFQNSIVANNAGGNCSVLTVASMGYNLSSDNSCKFSNAGDRNDINPMLGALQNNGGPTQTMQLFEGSPAIDAGNPSGCTDGNGYLLKTDQRGYPRPDKEDTGGCDIGAVERQSD